MKPADVQLDKYIEYGAGNNDKDSKLKIDDHVEISKYKNNFAKCCTHWSKKVFTIKKVKNTVLWIYIISNLNGEEVGKLYEKEL